MKRFIFFVILMGSLLFLGCAPTHKHCISKQEVMQSVPYCCKYGAGYCESTCYRTSYVEQCQEWACDSGYVEVDGKCVKRGSFYSR